ncbi:MAG: branched-chain amino acid transport system II carrier protein, partial [Gammaproteobacteria bacterium]
RPMLYTLLVLSTGFAMFAMFFGSGNLVFPIMLGGMVEGSYVSAAIGLVLTAICVPFLGFFAIYLFKGNYEAFFHRLGKYADFFLPLLILALIGPFGVIPRCITVAHGSFLLLFPEASFITFAAIMSIVIFLLVLDPHKIVPLIGAFLTPILLISLGLIIVYGVAGGRLLQANNFDSLSVFVTGLVQGYNTLDLMAAFFFSAVVIKYVHYVLHKHRISKIGQKQFIWATMLCGMGMLTLVYVAFIYLGAAYADVLEPAHPERGIALIADHTLGRLAGPVVVIAVILTTLTTAAALTSISAEFLRRRIFFDKVRLSTASLIIVALSFLFSNLKFSGIAAFLSPILQVLYPGLIVLTLFNIAHRLWGVRIVKTPVYATFALTFFMALYY